MRRFASRARGKAFFLALAAFLLLAACAKPPTAQMEKARRVVREAEEIGALEKAPNLYNTAEELLDQAESEMRRKRYEGARLAAEHAIKKALKAIEKSKTACAPLGGRPAAPASGGD